jgi:hypothetical protein
MAGLHQDSFVLDVMQCWLVDIYTSLEGNAILLHVVIYQSARHNISEDLTIQ